LATPAGCKTEITAPFCTVTLAKPQSKKEVSYKTIGSGTTREIEVTANITGMKYTQSAFCPTGGGTFENGKYEGTGKVTGESGGKHVGVWFE
jgi:hypothetical protein